MIAVRPVPFGQGVGSRSSSAGCNVSAHALAARDSVFSFDSAYQSIRIVEEKTEGGRTERVLMMGGGRASGIYADNGETSFEYVRAAERALAETKPETVLVIGAAGFTFPRDAANFARVRTSGCRRCRSCGPGHRGTEIFAATLAVESTIPATVRALRCTQAAKGRTALWLHTGGRLLRQRYPR